MDDLELDLQAHGRHPSAVGPGGRDGVASAAATEDRQKADNDRLEDELAAIGV